MPKCPKCEDENPQLGAKCPRDGFYYVYDEAYELAQKDPRIGMLAADKYVIIGRISKGGMGAVYLAMQLPVEREVAFKVLRTEMEGSDKSRDRFIREARAVSKLTHPNIITLYDFGFDENNHPYMAMEYAPGEDLSKWLRRDDLSIERILHVIRQLLGALDAAHIQGIVHRDLKPENMIVTETSRDRDFVKLLDFGIARMINETSTRGLTREGEVFGTPHYMAPEQAQGAKEVGPAADVYAVGIMLYELITGSTPYDAPTPLAVLLMHINEPLPRIVPRAGITMTEGLIALIERATHKDANQRFADAGEMLGALDHLITQNGLHATGAFMGVALADHSGDFSRPSTIQSVPVSNAESHAPTLNTSPPTSGSGPYSEVAVHDPDPSSLISQEELAQVYAQRANDADMSDEYIPARPKSNKAIFVVLATILILVFVAGTAVAVLSNQQKNQDQEVANTEVDTTNEIAQKEQVPPPKQEDTVLDKPPATPDPVIEDGPAVELIGTTDPTIDQPEIIPVEKDPVVPEVKPEVPTPEKEPVVKKTRPSKKKDPPKQEEPAKKEDPPVVETPTTVKKDTWGAPTQEQKEKFKKNDKW